MALGTCNFSSYVGKEVIGLGFETCTSDCVAASLTDGLLAVHAAWATVRVSSFCGGGPLGKAALAWPLVNMLWSFTGAFMWWQHHGSRPWWFEHMWRANAQVQAGLVLVGWLMFRATLEAMGYLGTTSSRLLGLLAVMHTLAFAMVTILPTCAFENYVLAGAANVTPPLMALFLLLILLVHRHKLRWSHPLNLAVCAGLPFWFGNAGVILGRGSGPARWFHDVSPEWWNWDEMATFHIFGLVGNDMLWRAFAWMAATEAIAEGKAGWLARALAADLRTDKKQARRRLQKAG